MFPLSHQSIGFNFSSELALLALKGIGLQYVDSPAYSWDNRNRTDSHCILQYCLDGEGALEVEGITYPVRKDDAFLIDIPGPNHYYLPEGSDHWEFIYLEFTKECLPLIWKLHRALGPVISFGGDPTFLDRILDIYQLALQDTLHSYFENSRVAYDLWMRMAEYGMSLSAGEVSKADHAKTYMDQHYNQSDLSLDEIADQVGMSKYTLCKEFHKKYGVTPGRYLKELRISQSCRLLMTKTDYTLQEIAEMVGFANNNYFGKVFKAEKGITPDKYRNQAGKYDLVRAVYETPHL